MNATDTVKTFQIGDILRQVSRMLEKPVIFLLICGIALAIFLLGWLMVGYQTQVLQGQPMSYVTRYSDVVWAVLLIPAGRFLLCCLGPLQGIHQQAHARPSAAGNDVERLRFVRLGEEVVARQIIP